MCLINQAWKLTLAVHFQLIQQAMVEDKMCLSKEGDFKR